MPTPMLIVYDVGSEVIWSEEEAPTVRELALPVIQFPAEEVLSVKISRYPWTWGSCYHTINVRFHERTRRRPRSFTVGGIASTKRTYEDAIAAGIEVECHCSWTDSSS